MAELLVSAVVSPLLQVAFEKLISSKAIPNRFRRQTLRLRLLERLKITMLSINKVSDDAEEKETTNRYVKVWLDELKIAIYDAEDVLDVISVGDHTYNMRTGVRRLTRKLRPSWNPFDTTIDKKLDSVLQRFEDLLQQKDVLGLKESHRPNSESETSSRLQSTSLAEESDVYGRNVDKESITQLVLSNDQSNASVIAIVGMGGIGKTTLAQLVFNSDKINEVFELNKVWICVSQDYNIAKITRNILHKLTSRSYDTNDLDLLQTKLRDTLFGKKFLVVFDDIWNENERDWDELRKPFNVCAPGSKMIVTTRITTVASAMRATSTYKLQVLSDDDCWLLFAKHAFQNISPSLHSKFEVVGRKLVKKCHGLPLAARVLGGLLRTKVEHAGEWDEVLNNDIWNSSDEESKNRIIPVLRLSYHYLPSELKRCFGFCSLIPKDYEFKRDKIVLLWMAESLLPDRGGEKKRRDVGYEYLRDLESRSLIQPCKERKSCFEMHDLVNDLAAAVSGDIYKRCDIGNSFEVGKQTRHFSYLMPDKFEDNDLARLQVISEAKCLRTLILSKSTTDLYSNMLPQLYLIRTLVLSNSNMEKLPSSIENLKLLRYLDISNNEQLVELPESVANLYKLEVLIVKNCALLTKLPSKLKQLTELNHLDIKDTFSLKEMPLQMGSLKKLDVLTGFVLGMTSGSSIGELKELKNLRGQLHIRGLQNITHPNDALEANLKEKPNLEKLRLHWDVSSDDSEDARIKLENLRPHANLKNLDIWTYGGTRLPNWSGHLVNLVDIVLIACRNCYHLSPLGQLPSLKSLEIFECDSLVTLVDSLVDVGVGGHFSALVKLNIYNCPKLELPQHGFTSIQEFTLDGGSCASLRFFPLRLFPKLKKLNLKDVKSIESLGVMTDEANNINLEYLEDICIQNCPNFEYMDAGKWGAPKMTGLQLENCESLKVLPKNMCKIFPSIEKLFLDQCPNLEAFPQSGLPDNLMHLNIKECNKLIANRSSWGLQKLLSLSKFVIGGNECNDLESFPEEGLLPNSLSVLWIEGFPNLRNLNGKSFQLLTCLDVLALNNCPNVLCLPELPTSLSFLYMWKCPLMESRLQTEQGEDWSKIAHIPIVYVDSLGRRVDL